MQQETTNQQNIKPVSFITDRKQLADPKVFDEFKDIVDKIIDSDNREEAVKARLLLEDILIGKYPQLKAEAPELFNKYQKLILLLKFEILSARPFSEIEDLVGNHLVEAIRAKIPIHKKFQDVLGVYDDISEEGGIAESLANAMLKSYVPIGNFQLTLGDKKLPSNIGNWLHDYDSSTRKPESFFSYGKRGPVERLSYINQSSNVRNLSEDERRLLLIVLELYDWLKYGTSFEESTMTNKASMPIVSVQRLVQAPRPVAPTPPRTPVSDFDQKLTQVSAPPAHGRDLEVLREQLEKGRSVPPVVPVQPKVFQTLAVKTPSPPAPLPQAGEGGSNLNKINLTPDEIKREVTEIELPASTRVPNALDESTRGGPSHQEPKEIIAPKFEVPKPAPVVFTPRSIPAAPIPQAPPIRTNLQSLTQISMVDDLKKIEIAHLRQGPPGTQIQLIKSKILSLADANRLLPYYTVNAFEQSPLFRAYLQTGSSKITENKTEGGLSQAEFEAIADFKKEIERL